MLIICLSMKCHTYVEGFREPGSYIVSLNTISYLALKKKNQTKDP